jgi:hypothetical protein
MYDALLAELERTSSLLEEAEARLSSLKGGGFSRIAAGEKRLDGGGRVKKRTGPRKKQKMTPALRARKKLEKKVRKKLQNKTYRNKHTGKDISFSTAYNLGHPKAVDDYNKTMASMASKDSPDNPVNQLSDVQFDLISRVAQGRDIRNMSLVEERTLREAMQALVGIHDELEEEGLDYEDEYDEVPEEPKEKKERKTRSDKGVKRGPYKKRLAQELEDSLPEEVKVKVNVDAMVDTPPKDADEITEALEGMEELRAPKDKDKGKKDKDKGKKDKDKGKKDKDKGKKDKDKGKKDKGKDKGKPAPKKDERVKAERAYIEDLLRRAISQIQDENIELLESNRSKVVEKLFSPNLSPERQEKNLERLKDKEKVVDEWAKKASDLEQKLADAKVALKDAGGDEKKSLEIEVARLDKKMKEAQRQVENEKKAISKIEKETFNSGLSPSEVKKLKLELESAHLDHELASHSKKNTEGGHLSLLESALESASDFTREEAEVMAQEYKKVGTEMANAISNLAPDEFNDYIDEEIKSVSAKVKKLKAKGGSDFAQAVGALSALEAAKKGIQEDPIFGLPKTPKNELEREEHNARTRASQQKKYGSMTKDQRDLMVTKLSALESSAKLKLENAEEGSAEYEEALGELNNIVESKVALNTSRMLNGEGVMEGFTEVEDTLLNLARQADDPAMNEVINALSRQDLDPVSQRSIAENGMSNLPDDKWAEAVGGDRGPYGDIVKALSPDFCPGTPANNAAGVGGRSLDVGDECPEPMPDDIKELMRDFVTSSMLDGYVVTQETDGKKKPEKKKAISGKRVQEIQKMWKANKEEFFKVLVEGKDSKDNPISEEDKEEFLTTFQMELRGANLRALAIPGVRASNAQDILKEIERVRQMKDKERKAKILELKKAFDEVMGHAPEASSGASGKQGTSIFNSLFIKSPLTNGGSDIMHKKSTVYVNYQERATSFKIGMRVFPFLGGNPSRSGIVVAIYPSIGMVDVQFPHGSMRYPVEDLVVDTSGDYQNVKPEDSSVPGGLGVVPVSSVQKVASTFMNKTALYWWAKNRRYRTCKDESPLTPNCPKCKTTMGQTIYKRRDSKSEKLLACPSCLFIIKQSDIVEG